MPASFTFPLACWMALQIGGTEIVGHGYARQPVTMDVAEDGVTIANTATVQFPMATANWGILDTVTLWDSATGGNLLGTGAAATPLLIQMYDRARVPAAGFDATQVSTPIGFGVGPFGIGHYATTRDLQVGADGVVLERTFDTSQHVCEPGTWAPGPFSVAA
jgi:hypothetical protein